MSTASANILKASFLVALSAALYGLLGYLGYTALDENLSISTMLFWRFLIAGLWISFFVLKNLKHQTPLAQQKNTLAFVFSLGALSYAGGSGFYFIASQSIGTGLAMVIFFSYPLLIAAASLLFHRQKISKSTLFILALMVAGLYLLRHSDQQSLNLSGIFFGLCAAGCYAFYLLSSKKFISPALDSNTLTMTVCLGSALIFLLFSIYLGQFALPSSSKGWLALLALGILATALPIQLMLEGLKTISSLRASIISVLEPLVTLVLGMLLLGETLSGLQSLGGFMILISALLIQFQKDEGSLNKDEQT